MIYRNKKKGNDIGAQFAHTKHSPEVPLDFCVTPNHLSLDSSYIQKRGVTTLNAASYKEGLENQPDFYRVCVDMQMSWIP